MPTDNQTVPAPAPGLTTTEYKLAKALMVFGGVLGTIGTVLTTIQETGLVPASAQWLNVALIVVGALTALLSKFDYSQGRVELKVAHLEAHTESNRIARLTSAGVPVPIDGLK